MSKPIWMIRSVAYVLVLIASVTYLQAQDLGSINIDELSDAQIKKYASQAAASGYSESQLEVMARARGMSESQITKLRARMNSLGSGSTTATNLGEGGRLRDSPESGQDPFGGFGTKSKIVREEGLSIFGMSYFSNRNLSINPSLNMPTPKNYVIGTGDEIVIDIWGTSERTYERQVSPEGSIIIPSIGPIYVNGLTMERAESRIKSKLKSIYSSLDKTSFAQVTLGRIRTVTVNVIGEVDKPGSYQMPSLATAFNALFFAGGPNRNGTMRKIEVFRQGEKIGTLDVYDFLIEGSLDNIVIQDQDVILVKPYLKRVQVRGEVKRPALFELEEGENLEDLLKYAGGFTPESYTAQVSVRRVLDDGRTVLTVNRADFQSFAMQSGDEVRVSQIREVFDDRVRIEGAVNHPGEFQMANGMMLSELVKASGGFREDAYMTRAAIVRQNDDLTLTNIEFSPADVRSGSFDLELRSEDLVNVRSLFDMRQSYSVSIRGEVNAPATYPYSDNMTVENLIFLAKGFKERAAKSFVEVARRVTDKTGNGTVTSEIFNFPINENLTLEKGSQFLLEPFDLVVIRESPFYEDQRVVKIEGQVIYPGNFVLQSREDRISDVLLRAGGLNEFAYAEGATLIRRTEYYANEYQSGQSAQIRRSELGDIFRNDTLLDKEDEQFKRAEPVGIELEKILKNPGSEYDLILREGDVIVIPGQLQTVHVRGEILHPSTVASIYGDNLREYVALSGGFTDGAKKNKVYVVYPTGSADKTRSFLWFRNFPEVTPGSEIIVPRKPEKHKMTTAEIASISTGLATATATLTWIAFQIISSNRTNRTNQSNQNGGN